MFSFFTEHEFMPCAECGASLSRAERDGHVCEEQRRLEYGWLKQVRELDVFDDELATYLSTPVGRFELYYAQRDRLRRAA